MSNARLTGKNIASGFIYVFLQHADYPERPSYIRMNLEEGSWSNPVTLTVTSLHSQENGVYACDPRAIAWNNKIYLFGRDPRGGIEVLTTSDGESWSSQTLLSKSWTTLNAVTPVPWNNHLLIFYTTPDSIFRCDQYDQSMNIVGTWDSSFGPTLFPLGVIPNQQTPNTFDVFYNANGSCFYRQWHADSGFSSPYLSGPTLSQSPSPLICAGGVFLATRGGGSDRILYLTQKIPTPDTEATGTPKSDIPRPAVIKGVNIYTAPSAVVLDDTGTAATIAVFYVESDDSHGLRMAIINIDNSTGAATYSLVNMQVIGIPVAGANASPFAFITP